MRLYKLKGGDIITMSNRIKESDIRERIEYINTLFDNKVELILCSRYGYFAIDYRKKGYSGKNTLRTGLTKNEIDILLDGFTSGIDFYNTFIK